jgi:hypothetical protein
MAFIQSMMMGGLFCSEVLTGALQMMIRVWTDKYSGYNIVVKIFWASLVSADEGVLSV